MKRVFILTDQFEKLLSSFSSVEELLRDIEQEIFKDIESAISSRDSE